MLLRAAVALLLSGCATVLAGGPDRVPVVTIPQGADIYLNGKRIGVTPQIVELERDAPAVIQVTKLGYETRTFERKKTLNAPFLLSMLFIMTIVPPVVDIVTSNWLSYDDAPVAVRLKPVLLQQPPPPRPRPPAPAPPEPLPPVPYVPPGTR